ncbi:NADH:ubiquinone reductase (Na(+)-transporting) subunit F [Peptoniphilus catoniae]|uniref:NADH:ubiquinone reductase (Na(+)-transporting) subunit F n=1 Tax=Peptoniphilus catoniae TaxID=1660341 RepID=UPI0010FD0FB8|nr:2Fe-2S iron-sulfur cluster binding domain-containing protein [Peptoniphilus catoniae]
MNELLTTTLVITAISVVLALILTLANKYLADYGKVKITINKEKEYEVDGGSSLLSSLVGQGIFIPSACGGKGSCGYCKVKVLNGAGPVLATEKPWLSKEELNDKVRLSCQVKVRNDIEIQIPEELFNVREYETTLVKRDLVTDKIAHVRFELPEGETINFKPGQFMQIKAPEYAGTDEFEGNDEEVFRAYSIASSIKDTKHVEFLIGYEKGACSTYIHKVLKEGDKVMINGPYGDFYYHDDDADTILLVAAGTGFAPIRSILYHMRDQDIKKKTRFFFGARTPADLPLVDEMEQFEKDLADFKFIPTLSRTKPEHHWEGDTGHVDDSIDKYVDGEGKYSCYLCGNPKMIASIVEALHKKNIPDDRIFFDEF